MFPECGDKSSVAFRRSADRPVPKQRDNLRSGERAAHANPSARSHFAWCAIMSSIVTNKVPERRANERFSPWIKYGEWDELKNWWPISGLVMHSPAANCLLWWLIFKISQREPKIRLKWWQKKPLQARSRQNYFLNYLAIVHLAHQTKWGLFSLADCDIWSKEFSSRPDESNRDSCTFCSRMNSRWLSNMTNS